MPLMLSHLYDALLEAGASPDAARKAAEEAALPTQGLADIRTDLAVVKSSVEHVQHRLTVLTWTMGIGVSLVMAMLLLVLNWLWQLMQRIH
jgi:hypothetical protein